MDNIYESIIQGLNEAVEYEKGNIKAKTIRCTVNPIPNFSPQEIRDLRNNLSMTQSTFAAVIGVSQKTIEAWERGTNEPIGSARRILSMLQADPSLPVKYHIIQEC